MCERGGEGRCAKIAVRRKTAALEGCQRGGVSEVGKKAGAQRGMGRNIARVPFNFGPKHGARASSTRSVTPHPS